MVCLDEGAGQCSGHGTCVGFGANARCVCDPDWHGYGDLVWRVSNDPSGVDTDCALYEPAVQALHIVNLVVAIVALVVVCANLYRRIRSGTYYHAGGGAGSGNGADRGTAAAAGVASPTHSSSSGGGSGSGGRSCMSMIWRWPNQYYVVGTCVQLTSVVLAILRLTTPYSDGAAAEGQIDSAEGTVVAVLWIQFISLLGHEVTLNTARTFVVTGHLSAGLRDTAKRVNNQLRPMLYVSAIVASILNLVPLLFFVVDERHKYIIAALSLVGKGAAIGRSAILFSVLCRLLIAALKAHQRTAAQHPAARASTVSGGVSGAASPHLNPGGLATIPASGSSAGGRESSPEGGCAPVAPEAPPNAPTELPPPLPEPALTIDSVDPISRVPSAAAQVAASADAVLPGTTNTFAAAGAAGGAPLAPALQIPAAGGGMISTVGIMGPAATMTMKPISPTNARASMAGGESLLSPTAAAAMAQGGGVASFRPTYTKSPAMGQPSSPGWVTSQSAVTTPLPQAVRRNAASAQVNTAKIVEQIIYRLDVASKLIGFGCIPQPVLFVMFASWPYLRARSTYLLSAVVPPISICIMFLSFVFNASGSSGSSAAAESRASSGAVAPMPLAAPENRRVSQPQRTVAGGGGIPRAASGYKQPSPSGAPDSAAAAAAAASSSPPAAAVTAPAVVEMIGANGGGGSVDLGNGGGAGTGAGRRADSNHVTRTGSAIGGAPPGAPVGLSAHSTAGPGSSGALHITVSALATAPGTTAATAAAAAGTDTAAAAAAS